MRPGFDSTYEGLKQVALKDYLALVERFDSTYEGLKLHVRAKTRDGRQEFRQYL